MKLLLAFALLSASLTFAARVPAFAQANAPVAETPVPGPGGRSGSAPGGNDADTGPGGAGEGVARGVIKPPTDVDPGIRRSPPPMDFPSRVIPPPGTPGGDPTVQPK